MVRTVNIVLEALIICSDLKYIYKQLSHHIPPKVVLIFARLQDVIFVVFEVVTAMTMKNAVFWDVTLPGSYKSQISVPRRRHSSTTL
jgi:hypothetical protein